MNTYLLLACAIFFEVLGTLLLPISKKFTALIPTAGIIIAYCTSFYLLSILSQRMHLAIIYATWSGLGILSITLLSMMIYQQHLNWSTVLGLSLIIMGVVIVHIYQPVEYI
jgi:small multidrug resistance pump